MDLDRLFLRLELATVERDVGHDAAPVGQIKTDQGTGRSEANGGGDPKIIKILNKNILIKNL